MTLCVQRKTLGQWDRYILVRWGSLGKESIFRAAPGQAQVGRRYDMQTPREVGCPPHVLTVHSRHSVALKSCSVLQRIRSH